MTRVEIDDETSQNNRGRIRAATSSNDRLPATTLPVSENGGGMEQSNTSQSLPYEHNEPSTTSTWWMF